MGDSEVTTWRCRIDRTPAGVGPTSDNAQLRRELMRLKKTKQALERQLGAVVRRNS
jgi:hypothetical protein